MVTQKKQKENQDRIVIEKLDFDDLNPIVGPLELHEKQIILDARKFVIENTPLEFPTPYFFKKTNLQGEAKEYLWIAWTHNHPELKKGSQAFFWSFEAFLQTLALQKWLSNNNEVTSLIFKLEGDLKIIERLDVNAHLQLSEIFELLKQARSRLTDLVNLLQPVDENERSDGGSPVMAKRLLFKSLKEHRFYSNHKDYVQLTPSQIIYVLVGLGIWLPYTDKTTNETVKLKDLVKQKTPSVRADIRRAKNPKRKVIQLTRIAHRSEP